MQQYALKRIGLFIPTVLLVTIIIFVIMRLIPGDPALAILNDGDSEYSQAELDTLLAEADAVHLGQTDIPPSAIPEDVRKRLAIGRSTHTLEELETTQSEPVDYIAFGPVFGTTSKESEFDARGLEALTTAVRPRQNEAATR